MSRSTRGFGLIDVIVGTALMLVLFMALFGVLRASLTLSTLAKAKAAATELASSQMEYLHGLSYDAIGTIGGIPAGTVAQNATSTIDGISYGIRTYIVYADDPADGVGINDTNGITTDYKMGKVTVSYSIYGLTKSVVLASNFVPPGIEAATNGGTLSIHVVDATGAGMSGATVHIVNTALTPSVDFTTFSNATGFSVIDGAATSSQYQVFVSRSGYSSAQTYARVSPNVNPNPGYLTIAKNQTTGATFAIDKLATLTLASFSPAVTTMFTDAFASSANLASMNQTQVSGGTLTLASQPAPIGYALSGSARSISISPSGLDGWGILDASLTTPPGTTAVVRVDDGAGTPIPDAVLPGNSTGFSTFPVSLTGLATSSYPQLSLEALLSTNATTTAPTISSWSLSHTEGPLPLPNIAFTLTGAKTIGTDANNAPLYKTIVSDTTGAAATKTETLEWDVYTPSFGSSPLIESCTAAPYQLMPGTATTTALIFGTPTTNTLPVVVTTTAGDTIPNAKVVLTTGGYAATVPTSSCGFAYFSGLASSTYALTVSAPGHATTTVANVSVTGHAAATTVILP